MKKALSITLSLMLLIAMFAGCSSGTSTEAPITTGSTEEQQVNDTEPTPSEEVAGTYTPGTYTATEQGHNGSVTVSVTFDADAITGVAIGEHSETAGISDAAIERIPESIVAGQTLAVDAVAGATVTSNAILAAVESCVLQAGGDIEALKAGASTVDAGEKELQKLDADVVIVGAGGAGLSAAVTAAQGGAKVLLIEKMAMAGGATAMAGGGTNATGSQAQKDAGIEDSPEQLAADIAKNGHDKNDPDTTMLYATTVGRMFDWISSPDGAGVEYDLESVPKPSAEHSVGRNFSAVGGGGAVVNTLLEKAESLGVQVMFETPATELMMDGGKVVGVKAQGADGTPYEISAKSVILATGGYGANTELLNAETAALPYAGAVSATGDGLIMAQAAGADTFDLDLVNIQPHSIKLPDGRGQHTYQGCLAMYGGTGSILVSDQGERFVNEQASANDVIAGMKQHGRSFLVMDDASFNTYTETCIKSRNYTEENLKEWVANNGASDTVFATGATLEEVAEAVGMPGDALKASVDTYNGYVDAGEDKDFGRNVSEKMGDGPYYLVEMHLRYYATLGGLKINDHMQVMDANAAPIEGLYAAGEVVGGVLGDIYIPGGLFGWAMTSGHNAGLEVTGN